MTSPCRICNCIDAIIVAIASAEAMEHNAIVSKESKAIGSNIQKLISQDNYEILTLEHDWLESPIKEPFAELAFHLSIRDIESKCQMPEKRIDSIIELFDQGTESHNKGEHQKAQTIFIDVKNEVMKLAQNLCKDE